MPSPIKAEKLEAFSLANIEFSRAVVSLNFSPLFIGEVSSTSIIQILTKRPERNFSPLFIGEVSSTELQHRHPVGRAISVPSSSGKSLQQLVSRPVFSKICGWQAEILRKPPTCRKYREVCENPASKSVAFTCLRPSHFDNPLFLQKISPQ